MGSNGIPTDSVGVKQLIFIFKGLKQSAVKTSSESFHLEKKIAAGGFNVGNGRRMGCDLFRLLISSQN